MDALSFFHPIIQTWFKEQVGTPTDVQESGWNKISTGEHLLLTAPTGSGKTLAAFLWALNQLLTGTWESGAVRVLYISPLKALNNDVQKNLLAPLDALRDCFEKQGVEVPAINVQTRSGDTPQSERQRMLRRPPEILITTPESLNILLTSKNGRRLFTFVQSVILDEVHAIYATKRGTHLITAIERLTALSGEFQRIALSATVRPLENVARFVGGFMLRQGDPATYQARKVLTVSSSAVKQYAVRISFPGEADKKLISNSWWPALVDEFIKVIREHNATLFFANSRRLTEKITRFINEKDQESLVYSHHGSLSKEIRLTVEQKLKAGELKAIVATNSLELGIDIGDLDCVVLVQSPASLASAVQKIGRAGHTVGEVSRGIIFPTHGRDFIEAAVTARAIVERDIEAMSCVDAPLDVLAQIILSMCVVQKWDIDGLFNFIRQAFPYRELSRVQYDLVIEMLAGRYAESRLRELKPRVHLDKLENSIVATKGSELLLYMAGGTIPDRGYYDLRVSDSKAKIGELDEEFVWERTIGDTFALGAQTWRIMSITHNDVEVVPVASKPGIIPFWRAEDQFRDFYFSEKIGAFLEYAEEHLSDTDFAQYLEEQFFLDSDAATQLISFLKLQQEESEAALPHRHHLLIEHFEDAANKADSKQVVLHTLWGGKVNKPFALALSAAWEEQYKYKLEVFANNNSILLLLPHAFQSADIFKMVRPENLEQLRRARLEKSGFFGARFRENAGRALLLPKLNFKKRLPLWFNRLRSKKLFDAVLSYHDFPIMIETWRTCLEDSFDLVTLKELLDEVATSKIAISETVTQKASPFCGELIWRQTNKHMYEDDTPDSAQKSGLSEQLFREIFASPFLRPRLPVELITNFVDKLQRLAVGYTPSSSGELMDWLRDRIVVPFDEWTALCAAIHRDHEKDAAHIIDDLHARVLQISLGETVVLLVDTIPSLQYIGLLRNEAVEPYSPIRQSLHKPLKENLAKVLSGKNEEQGEETLASFMAQWLSWYGPVPLLRLRHLFSWSVNQLDEIIEELVAADLAVVDIISDKSSATEICDRENLERLLRINRRARQPDFSALPISHLPLFIAQWQGVLNSGESLDGLQSVLEKMFGYPAPVSAWEEYIFPVRLKPYYSAWLDSLMQSSSLNWYGAGDKKIYFAFQDERELFPINEDETLDDQDLDLKNTLDNDQLFVGRYDFLDIVKKTGLPSAKVSAMLWRLAWHGRVVNDSFAVLRRAILNGFKADKVIKGSKRVRGSFDRWKSSRPLPGSWSFVPPLDDLDPLEEEELNRERVRQLFARYGILFRELLARELPCCRWGPLFKTLRLMELSGELLTGHFFEGIPGLQFISHAAFERLCQGLDKQAIFMLNAADPASLCGIQLESLKGNLPRRIPSNEVYYHGDRLVAVLQKGKKALQFFVEPEYPQLPEIAILFKTFLNREFNPIHSLLIEKINDEPAQTSPYAQLLRDAGFSGTFHGLELRRSY